MGSSGTDLRVWSRGGGAERDQDASVGVLKHTISACKWGLKGPGGHHGL